MGPSVQACLHVSVSNQFFNGLFVHQIRFQVAFGVGVVPCLIREMASCNGVVFMNLH